MEKIWTEEEIRAKIQESDTMVCRSLLKLYSYQTYEEKEYGAATDRNGMGFNGIDAPILTSFSEFLNKTGFLTEKQIVICRKKLMKYAKQLTKIANMA